MAGTARQMLGDVKESEHSNRTHEGGGGQVDSILNMGAWDAPASEPPQVLVNFGRIRIS